MTYQIISAPDEVDTDYTPRGGCADFIYAKEPEVIAEGPSETGKTLAACWKIHLLALKYPGLNGAIVRKTRKSMDGSVLQTFNRVIEGAPVSPYGGERPEHYNYSNGSRIWIGGMDNPDRILSSERDFFYVNQVEDERLAHVANDSRYVEALTKAVTETMSEQAQRVMIPRKVGLAMRDMYWNQHRFEKREGRHPRYFLNRPGFTDAFEYLRFKSETTGGNRELRAWWKEFVKANPVTPGEAPREAKERRKPGGKEPARPSRRRRRGRRREGGPDARKPKI